MKRLISIFLLATASLILLAHSAVPHHHHNGVVVDFIRLADVRHHHHDEAPASEDSQHNVLSLSILNSQKIGIAVDYYPLTVIIKDASNETVLLSEPIRHRPYLLLHHSFFDIHSNGLRAPPIC